MTLEEALTRAVAGDVRELYALLSRGSGLPGPRVNLPLAKAFADVCGSDAGGPALASKMAAMPADEAPGGTVLEMLPVCGVLAAGACAVHQPASRSAMLEVIHDACEDLRFRVRDAVPLALAQIGAKEGTALLGDLDPFMEGYFHAAAVLASLTNPDFLPRIDDGVAASRMLGRALALANDAPRAAARWPGYKALVLAIEAAIAPLAIRFGEPVLAVAEAFRSRDPHLREMLVRALSDKKLRSRLPDEHRRAVDALTAQTKGPRDPRSAPRPTRKRGGGRRRD